LLLTGKKVNNSKIRKFLEARCANKEVWLPYVKKWCYRNARNCNWSFT
jgi:hypothetical protein